MSSPEQVRILAEQARWETILRADGAWEAIGNGPVKPEERQRGLTGMGERDRLASGEPNVQD